jgi:spore maturation protein CgeB
LFSKINQDTYTRRCFEIPATKTLMICEYSKDMAENLFAEGEEAVYFRSSDELIQQVRYYLANEGERVRIANNACEKLHSDGHNITDRCKQVLDTYSTLMEVKHHV